MMTEIERDCVKERKREDYRKRDEGEILIAQKRETYKKRQRLIVRKNGEESEKDRGKRERRRR